jgi:endogenous inhibitor of DNA gyrase (YacG/DUF329 family)
LEDLGKWFGEEHIISEPLRAEDPQETPENSDPRQVS